MADEPGHARAGPLDLLRLGLRMGRGWLGRRRRFDAAAVGCRWARELLERDGGDDLDVGALGRTVRVVGRRDHSNRILEGEPGAAGGYGTAPLKRNAMAFLAPGALTVADGERWARLRAFNERVLEPGGLHPLSAPFLGRVRAAFRPPVRNLEDVREAMGRAMVGIVLGEAEPDEDPAADVRALFGAVQSPIKRTLLGFRYRGRRERLFALLERRWNDADGEPTLLGRARSVAAELEGAEASDGPDAAGDALSRAEILQQVPHWMFTFTGSGSDLLGRALALVTARPEVHGRVVDEIAAAGDPTDPATLEELPWVDACLREAGRLFPPVTRTFHRRSDGDGPQLVHWFPLLQRDPGLGASVHAFRPQRWLEPAADPATRASNLFLRGPRACPGEDLILLVCRAALARQLGEVGLDVRRSRLSRDPLPVSFPDGEARFIPQEDP